MPLVMAAACPHTPQLLIRPETEDRDLVLRVHAAYAKVKRLLAEARAEVICVIAGDHVEGFFLNAVPAFAVYAGAEVSGRFGTYTYTFPVHEALARAILEQSIEREFDLTYSQDVRLDYAFYVPLHFAMPEPRVPIATETAPEEALKRLPGPEILGQGFVLAAQLPMDQSGKCFAYENGKLVGELPREG